ncbi:MAG TPA: hypothetical protein VEB69_14160 [Acidimicrobiia bacterium]|nr:hypothetical protein [Acidimicrobiia bacterium]
MPLSPKEMMRRVGQPTRLILFLSLVVATAAIALAVMVTSGDGNIPEAGSDGGATAGAGQVSNATGTSPNSDTSGSSGDPAPTSDESVSAAVDEACRQFESGATVADFAVWFETNWEGANIEAAFREVIEDAVTRVCPQVVPSD